MHKNLQILKISVGHRCHAYTNFSIKNFNIGVNMNYLNKVILMSDEHPQYRFLSLKFEITVYFSGFLCQFIQGH